MCVVLLTRSLREPGGPCTKSMEVEESRIERVKRSDTLADQEWRGGGQKGQVPPPPANRFDPILYIVFVFLPESDELFFFLLVSCFAGKLPFFYGITFFFFFACQLALPES